MCKIVVTPPVEWNENGHTEIIMEKTIFIYQCGTTAQPKGY